MIQQQRPWRRFAWLLVVGITISVQSSAFVPVQTFLEHKRPFELLIQQSASKAAYGNDDNEERSYWSLWRTSSSTVADSSPTRTPSKRSTTTTWSRTLSDGSSAISLKREDLLPARAVDAISLVYKTISEIWWLSPILLCFVPLISQLFFSTLPATPEVWKLVNLPALCQNNAYFVAGFLASNISYLASAGLLGASRRFRPAAWVLAAGLVSSAFHTVQTFGTYSLAEAWCYLDHGVAITAILYFWRTFGLPNSKLFWGTAAAGLLTLVAPTGNNGKIYTVMHSAWHVFSASAAVIWALEHRPRKSAA